MTPIMPTRVMTFTSMPSSAELMKSWTASMSLVTRVIRSPQVVPHPLADAGRQVFLEVGADGADNRDHRHCRHGEVDDGVDAVAEESGHDPLQPIGKGL